MRNHIRLLASLIGLLKLVEIELKGLAIFALVLLLLNLDFIEERHRHVRCAHGPEHA